jgi:hypothetical protein
VEEQTLDYEVLTQQIYGVVSTIALEGVTGLGIFSRPCDQQDPDWQIFLDLAADPEAEFVETAVLDEPQATIDGIETAQPQSESLTVIQEEVKAELPPDVAQTPLSVEPLAIDPVEPAKTLADYCFIRNKTLVSAKVLPPEATIAKLVQFFDNLPAVQQLELLPILETYLCSPNPELLLPFDPEVQAWLQQLGQLKDMDARNIAIWLSRYCHDPAQTIEVVNAVLTNQPLASEKPPAVIGSMSSFCGEKRVD